MKYLVDTNILLRLTQESHPLFLTTRAAVNKLRHMGHFLQTASQNCIEFWNVATRPVANNGFGLSLVEVDSLLHEIEYSYPLIPDTVMIYPEWRRLVVRYGVSGVQVHDARLVAAMKVYHLSYVLTYNTKDYLRYSPEGIKAVDPLTIAD